MGDRSARNELHELLKRYVARVIGRAADEPQASRCLARAARRFSQARAPLAERQHPLNVSTDEICQGLCDELLCLARPDQALAGETVAALSSKTMVFASQYLEN